MAARTTWRFGEAFHLSLTFVTLLFAVKGVEWVWGVSLSGWGILPRDPWGLTGVLFAPLLHANLTHLSANAGPLLVLLTLLFAQRNYQPGWSFTSIWILGGLGTWLIGRAHSGELPFIHLGASGLIYGLVCHLIRCGWRLRDWKAASVAALVLALYGGLFKGVIPASGSVSWEAHLCGAAAGFWAAGRLPRTVSRPPRAPRKKTLPA